MTYAIHTGTHETRVKNDEFALKARGPRPMVVPRPSQPLMMTSPFPHGTTSLSVTQERIAGLVGTVIGQGRCRSM